MLAPVRLDRPVCIATVWRERDEQPIWLQKLHRILERLPGGRYVLKHVRRKEAIKLTIVFSCRLVHLINSPNTELLVRVSRTGRGDLEGHNFKAGLSKLIAPVTP
jgi:hypothetical protein